MGLEGRCSYPLSRRRAHQTSRRSPWCDLYEESSTNVRVVAEHNKRYRTYCPPMPAVSASSEHSSSCTFIPLELAYEAMGPVAS